MEIKREKNHLSLRGTAYYTLNTKREKSWGRGAENLLLLKGEKSERLAQRERESEGKLCSDLSVASLKPS